MGREVRMVPADWQHPRDEAGRYIPLLDDCFKSVAEEWSEGRRQWKAGYRRGCPTDTWIPKEDKYAGMLYTEWAGYPPEADDYMPDFPAGTATHYMMYEDTTAGTPISPAFETPEELARWLADTGASAFGSLTATYDEWLNMIKRGSSVSAAIIDGRLVSGVSLE